MTSLQALAIILLALAPAIGASQSAALEQDIQVIESLRKNGSDLSKHHQVDYFFIMPSESAASQIAAELTSQKLLIKKVSRLPNQKGWEVYAQRSQLVQVETMQATTVAFTKLAERFGGYYDGWGAISVK